jgi:CheY-like chemotaxis protein
MKKRILIVDDEEDLLFLWEKIITGAGYDALKASRGEDAIKIAQSQHPDLIILDIVMPGMDGVSITDILQDSKSTRDIPIIYLSNLVHKDESKDGYVLGSRIGDLRFVPKSSSIEEILRIVKEVIGD